MTGVTLRGNDTGMALVTVLGIMLVISLFGIAAFTLASGALQSTKGTYDSTQAFQAADSGIDQALTLMQANGYRSNDYPTTGTMSDGSTFTASVVPLSGGSYRCTSTGHAPGGSGSTVTADFGYVSPWSIMMAGLSDKFPPSGRLLGNAGVTGAFFVRGDLVLTSSSDIEDGPLYVDGNVTLTGNGKVGEKGIVDVYITGIHPSAGSKGWNVNDKGSTIPTMSLASVNTAYLYAAYARARSESVDNHQGSLGTGLPVNLETNSGNGADYTTMRPPNSSTWTRARAGGTSDFYKVVGNAVAPSALNAGSTSLTLANTSFGSWFGDTHTTSGGQHDDFAYDGQNHILYVEGTVFVDGPLTISTDITYVGRGTIVCNGDITINGDLEPTTGALDNTHSLGLVATGDVNVNKASLYGSFFLNGTFNMNTTNIIVTGSVIAGAVNFGQPNDQLISDRNLSSYLPPSLPGSDKPVLTISRWTRS